jgi:LPXTG-motif cell wall-anchored protein
MTAQAEADDGISPEQVATDCTHGGPYKDQDVWVFDTTKVAKPETTQTDTTQTQDAAQKEATFAGPDGQTETAKFESQVYDLEGHSVAWLSAPAGWRLIATTPADLKVVGICEAGSAKEATVAGPAQAAAINDTGPINKQAAANEPAKTLPQTGQDVGAMVTVGAALVGTGIMLLFVRRKRPSPPPPRHRAGDRVWTYPVD